MCGRGCAVSGPRYLNYFRSAGRAQRVRWGLLIGLLVMRGVSLVGVSQSEVGINSNSNSSRSCHALAPHPKEGPRGYSGLAWTIQCMDLPYHFQPHL